MPTPTKNPLLDLPNEMKDLIVKHVDSIDTLQQLSLACRDLHEFISDPSELRNLFLRPEAKMCSDYTNNKSNFLYYHYEDINTKYAAAYQKQHPLHGTIQNLYKRRQEVDDLVKEIFLELPIELKEAVDVFSGRLSNTHDKVEKFIEEKFSELFRARYTLQNKLLPALLQQEEYSSIASIKTKQNALLKITNLVTAEYVLELPGKYWTSENVEEKKVFLNGIKAITLLPSLYNLVISSEEYTHFRSFMSDTPIIEDKLIAQHMLYQLERMQHPDYSTLCCAASAFPDQLHLTICSNDEYCFVLKRHDQSIEDILKPFNNMSDDEEIRSFLYRRYGKYSFSNGELLVELLKDFPKKTISFTRFEDKACLVSMCFIDSLPSFDLERLRSKEYRNQVASGELTLAEMLNTEHNINNQSESMRLTCSR